MGVEKSVIRPVNDTNLPNIPWILWEDGASAHLQQRRTITPPKTRSSLARKGEPGRAEQMPLQRRQSTVQKDKAPINGEFLLNPETATQASLFCDHQSKQNTWIGIRQTPAFYSNYINLGENKSFLSSHVQLWPIQTTESNYAVLVCLFYLAGCSANNVLLYFYGQVFGTFQVNGRSCNLMCTILQH